jgi:hypothetical protein
VVLCGCEHSLLIVCVYHIHSYSQRRQHEHIRLARPQVTQRGTTHSKPLAEERCAPALIYLFPTATRQGLNDLVSPSRNLRFVMRLSVHIHIHASSSWQCNAESDEPLTSVLSRPQTHLLRDCHLGPFHFSIKANIVV